MKRHWILCLFFLLSVDTGDAEEFKSYDIPRTQVIPVQDAEQRQYDLYIKLPESYLEKKDVAYPVIYFTDAVWHIELLSAATEFLMEDVILVGVSWQKDISKALKKEVGQHVSRFRDYSVLESDNQERQSKYQFGQASRHLAFIRTVVIPHVEANYRTDPNNRTYFGYSLGGVFGSYALLAEPDTFKNYILGSPALRGDLPLLSELQSSRTWKNLDANVFISYGNLETELGGYADQFIASLKTLNDKTLRLEQVVIDGSHQTAFPTTGIQSVAWLSQMVAGGGQSVE